MSFSLSEYTKIDVAQDPNGGAYSAPQTSQLVSRGPLHSRRGEGLGGWGRGEGRGSWGNSALVVGGIDAAAWVDHGLIVQRVMVY